MARTAQKPAADEDLLGSIGSTDTGPQKRDSKPKRATLVIKGLGNYAGLKKIEKEIDGLTKTGPVKMAVMRAFVEEGRKIKRTPQNMDGVDEAGKEVATASLQLRKKDNRTNLGPDVLALFNDLGITVEHYVIVPRALIVKPEYSEDKEMLNKVLKACRDAGLNPSEIFTMQNEVAREIPCDETLNDIFALGENTTDDRMVELLDMVAGVTVTSKWQGTLPAAFEVARQEFAPTPAEMKAREEAAAAAATADTAPKASNLMDALKASLEAEEADAAPKARKRG